MSKGLDPWSSNPTAAATTSTLHYLLQEKERAQAQEQLQIYHQQGFGSYLQQHRRQQPARGLAADGASSGESTPVDALAAAFGTGRIVRSAAGRKDRHSKVCTARGLRDRRVRLAAHTAIRFYDVQDRLGYDRPSKAVDWLIRNAKAAIEELPDRPEEAPSAAEPEAADQMSEQVTSTSSYGFGNPGGGGAAMTNSFLQHSLGGADQVSDNVKSLFPSSSTATASGHEEYRGSPPDLLSRTTSSQPQELCLTLQSNQHNIFSHVSPNHHGIMSSAGVPGWPDHGQRMPSSWHASDNNNAGEGRGAGGNGESYMFAGLPPRQGLDQSQLFSSNGETLQSSAGWAASARAWLDPLAGIHQPSPMSGQIGFSHLVGGGGGGFMGFLAPAAQRHQLHGEEEQGSDVMRRD